MTICLFFAFEAQSLPIRERSDVKSELLSVIHNFFASFLSQRPRTKLAIALAWLAA